MSEKYFQQPSVMSAQQHFSQVPRAEIERSRFDRSHALKTSLDAGNLVPIFVDEVLPGDTFHMSATSFARLATPLRPVMDNMYLDMHFFFVPYRLVWDNWQRFCGERLSPDDDPSLFSIPTVAVNVSGLSGQDIWSYFGIPVQPDGGAVSISSLPFRAYNLIYNEWYRDQNLQDPLTVSMGNGPDASAQFAIKKRGKRHDYFTSCLPWPQKGDAVVIPLGEYAPVVGLGTNVLPTLSGPTSFIETGPSPGSDGVSQSYAKYVLGSTANMVAIEMGGAGNLSPQVFADLQNATSISINDLRSAFQIQRLLERDARGGTRYVELVLSHFGVVSDDLCITRPQYLGGGTARVNINPIASTATTGTVPQANLAAVGTGVTRGGFTKSFTEHGVIIGLVSARADLTYQQGIERFWSRRTRYDFYWPALAHLGEQAVLNKEIYATGGAADSQAFGYQERFAEYRYKPSRVTGLFASNVSASLDSWHLAQDFSALPVLNASFIEENPPFDRIIAVPAEPHFLCDFWFDLKCDRPMPVYSVPGLIDHF